MSSNARKSNSLSKMRTIEFIKTPDDGIYEFEFDGDKSEAESFIQAMRVMLSRLRNKAKNRGYVIKHFKMTLEDISYADGKCLIKLKKKVTDETEVGEVVADVFKDLTVGKGLDVNG